MADKSKLWYIENFNLFSSLDDSKMMELNIFIRDEETKKNEPVYFANDPSKTIYFLKTGRVKISKYLSDGSEKIIALLDLKIVFYRKTHYESQRAIQ